MTVSVYVASGYCIVKYDITIRDCKLYNHRRWVLK